MDKADILHQGVIKLFTIGFVNKSATDFFNILLKAGVKRVVDIRLNNVSQLAGFTKRGDIEFFLNKIAGIKYTHRLDLAPTKEILTNYKNEKISWLEYEEKFLKLMNERHIENIFKRDELDHACLLCSEHEPDKCHRRLVAEYLKEKINNVEISHL